jgi:hypothetical protein
MGLKGRKRLRGSFVAVPVVGCQMRREKRSRYYEILRSWARESNSSLAPGTAWWQISLCRGQEKRTICESEAEIPVEHCGNAFAKWYPFRPKQHLRNTGH